MGRLKHYSIRGVAYSWFESYLKGRTQYDSINGFSSKDILISCGDPQNSVYWPLLFLLYITNFLTAIKFCKYYHIADGTNLLHISKSIKELSKFVNFDLKNLSNWQKSLRIISFRCRNAQSNSLFYSYEIVKLREKIIIKNSIFISKSINLDFPSVFHQ